MIVVGSRVRIKTGARHFTFTGKEGVVSGVIFRNYRRNDRSAYHVWVDGITYELHPDELEEITADAVVSQEIGFGPCDNCGDTTTSNKQKERCKHIVYMCCECKPNKRARCATCRRSYYTPSLDTGGGWQTYD